MNKSPLCPMFCSNQHSVVIGGVSSLALPSVNLVSSVSVQSSTAGIQFQLSLRHIHLRRSCSCQPPNSISHEASYTGTSTKVRVVDSTCQCLVDQRNLANLFQPIYSLHVGDTRNIFDGIEQYRWRGKYVVKAAGSVEPVRTHQV